MRTILSTFLVALVFTPIPIASAQTANQTVRAPARKPAATSPRPAAPAAPTTTAKPAPCDCTTTVAPPRHYAPYIAKRESTRVQTLSDGTTITNVTESQIWRDAEGRTRTETVRTQPDGSILRSISITDPVARTNLNWSTGLPTSTKIVNVFHYPQPVQPAAPPPATPRRYYPTRQESLPPQTIAGVYVEGYRSSRTTPAGYEGNNHDITATTEYWTSPELGLQMRIVTDDPRNGKTTTEITDLRQAAPDPTLFQPPAGYTVHENNPQ